MPELPRTRDVHILVKGPSYAVTTSQTMDDLGWPGGQGVRWIDGATDAFHVDFSDGERAGFLLWGSNEDSDVLTAMTENQPEYSFAVMGSGSWVISTRSFEQFTLASRLTPPVAAINYSVGDQLFFSLRGLWTIEDEWTIAGDPRAPNEFGVGIVVQAPSNVTSDYMTIQTVL